jgi:LuxR family maltose regulon positive regulatory protein
VDWLSETVRFEYPDLLGAAAIAASLIRRPAAERGHYLALADRARSDHSSQWTPYAEALYCLASAILIDGDVGQAVVNARRGIEVSGGGETELPSVACLAYALLLSGDPSGAREYAERAIRHPDADHRSQGVVVALATLALIEVDGGGIEQAEAHIADALELARAAGIVDGWVGGLAHVAHAATLAGRGRLMEAEHEGERGELLRRMVEPTVENTQARLVLAGVRVARGRLTQAAAELAHARRQIAGFADPGNLPAVADRVEAALTQAAADRGSNPPLEAPTVAELAVLELLPTALSQREIGAELFLSMNTVKTHVRELYRKLGVQSRSDAVKRAAALGLLDPTHSPR